MPHTDKTFVGEQAYDGSLRPNLRLLYHMKFQTRTTRCEIGCAIVLNVATPQ